MDYQTLQATIQNYLHRNDLNTGGGQTVNVDTFIELGQQRMNHDLDLLMMQTTATLTVTDGKAPLPSDFLRMKSVRVADAGSILILQQRTLQQNGRVIQNAGGSTGTPGGYAIYGGVMEITPSPADTTEVDIIYTQRLAKFTNPTDTDAILTTYPNIYIYAAMVEAGPFIVDDKMAARWRSYYQEEVARLNDLNEDAEWDGPLKQIINLGTDTP